MPIIGVSYVVLQYSTGKHCVCSYSLTTSTWLTFRSRAARRVPPDSAPECSCRRRTVLQLPQHQQRPTGRAASPRQTPTRKWHPRGLSTWACGAMWLRSRAPCTCWPTSSRCLTTTRSQRVHSRRIVPSWCSDSSLSPSGQSTPHPIYALLRLWFASIVRSNVTIRVLIHWLVLFSNVCGSSERRFRVILLSDDIENYDEDDERSDIIKRKVPAEKLEFELTVGTRAGRISFRHEKNGKEVGVQPATGLDDLIGQRGPANLTFRFTEEENIVCILIPLIFGNTNLLIWVIHPYTQSSLYFHTT